MSECDLCAAEGYPGQIGHSTLSCMADRILNPLPNDPVSNLEGDLGSLHMQGTPKAQGHEADNLSAESARKE